MNNQINIFLFSFFLFTISSCKEKAKEFDRAPMLENIGNNVIVPSYKTAHEKAQALKVAVADFTNWPDPQKLPALRTTFKEAYLAWQAVEVYDFAKGTAQTAALNTFPPDSVKIRNNALTGNYNLQAASNLNAKGFPALDFILFSSNDNDLVNLIIDFPTAKQYLQDIADDISTNITSTYDDWNTAQINKFTSATGLDIGGSIGILCNSWAQSTERNRRERVGNSLGYVGFISSGTINQKLLEGFHSNMSKELLVANLQAGKNLFTGGAGVGFDDYPQVKEATFQGVPLNQEISNQFDKCIAAANAITNDFKTALVNEKPKMETLFLELKKLTVLIKVDMASAIGVTINYTDNDGD
jgi:predicted lipoprotein